MKEADYEAFERVLLEAHERFPVEILGYCVMPNHWHFVLRPTTDDQLTAFLRWLAHTHTMALACPLPYVGHRAFVPRPIQGIPREG